MPTDRSSCTQLLEQALQQALQDQETFLAYMIELALIEARRIDRTAVAGEAGGPSTPN